MAHIEKRQLASGKVVYRARAKYKGRMLTSTHLDRRSAQRWSAQADALVRNDAHFEGDAARRRKLCELIDRYVRTVLPGKGNAYNQRLHLRWWHSRLGSYKLSEITRSVIAQCRDELLANDSGKPRRKPATVVRYLASLSHVFSVAIGDWEWAEVNPVRNVRKPPEPKGRDRYLNDDERERLLSACKASSSPDLYTVVVLALGTGMRRGEILGLTWGNVDLKSKLITLTKTKNGDRRTLPLCASAYDLLLARSKVRSIETDLIFPGGKRTKLGAFVPRDITKPWETARAKAGLADFRFHDLRHTAASTLAMTGASQLDIAAVLGHRSLQMTKRYTHLSVEHLRGVLERASQGVRNHA